jgi:hypothetical protein
VVKPREHRANAQFNLTRQNALRMGSVLIRSASITLQSMGPRPLVVRNAVAERPMVVLASVAFDAMKISFAVASVVTPSASIRYPNTVHRFLPVRFFQRFIPTLLIPTIVYSATRICRAHECVCFGPNSSTLPLHEITRAVHHSFRYVYCGSNYSDITTWGC